METVYSVEEKEGEEGEKVKEKENEVEVEKVVGMKSLLIHGQTIGFVSGSSWKWTQAAAVWLGEQSRNDVAAYADATR